MPIAAFRRPEFYLAAFIGLLLTGVPARLSAQDVTGPAPDLIYAAKAHYAAYGRALSEARREQIATFYDPQGALIIFNGVPGEVSREALDARYRGPWRPPAYFRFDTLGFRQLGTDRVLVTGGFLWQSPGQADTSHFQYTAVLVTADSGLAITFEQETRWPSP
jgi:hypothetical protein